MCIVAFVEHICTALWVWRVVSFAINSYPTQRFRLWPKHVYNHHRLSFAVNVIILTLARLIVWWLAAARGSEWLGELGCSPIHASWPN